MKRVASRPREDWQALVKAAGLAWPMTDMPDGTQRAYWDESARYELTSEEVDAIEAATQTLDWMCRQVVPALASGDYGHLGLPEGALDLALRSFEEEADRAVYGRFDLVLGEGGSIKMLEYNADTPTGLVETAVAQWQWLQESGGGLDQFNSVWDRLVERWKKLAPGLPPGVLHLATCDGDDTAEEWMTVEVMAETARAAGLDVKVIMIEHIHWSEDHGVFVDADDLVIEACFKLYPWEEMLSEAYGDVVMADYSLVRWVEPLWKVLLSSKMLSVALWDRFGDDPDRAKYLLPAYRDEIEAHTRLADWVRKPLHGREGDNITINAPHHGVEAEKGGGYGEEGWVWQAYTPLPVFEGGPSGECHTVVGSWVVGTNPAGIICRESDGPITDYYSRVVPHVIVDAAQPTADQAREWILEDAL